MTQPNKLEGPELVEFVAKRLFERRAEKVKRMDLKGLSDVCDYFLICTCQSEVQMRAIVMELMRDLRTNGVRPLGVEYRSGVRWAVLDLGDVIVHIFEENAREFYNLEKLWGDAESRELRREDYLTLEQIKKEDNEFF